MIAARTMGSWSVSGGHVGCLHTLPAPPGSREKVVVLHNRHQRGFLLHHPLDERLVQPASATQEATRQAQCQPGRYSVVQVFRRSESLPEAL